MTELLAAGTALSAASSLISFVDVAWRVLKRLKEYNDRAGDGPMIVKSINAQLPILIDKMEELKLETETGSAPINPQTSLAVAVTSCDELIQRLDVLTTKLLPDEMESRPKRLKKALSSVYYEKELSKTWGEIENYKTLLIFHFTKVKGAVQGHEESQSNKPIFMVPFEKDLRFVGRVDVIADIEQALKRQSRIAIAGIGGVGKSQIAIEYCYRFKEQHLDAQVFWVYTSTISRFRQAYNDIARRLLIPGWNDPNADALQLVYEHLTERTKCRWLLILDNADDRDMFFPSSNMHGQRGGISRYIPHNSQGSVIITTRDGRVGRKLANGEEPISISQMTIQEAKAMMLSRVSEGCCDSNLERLLRNLDCLPLAITQAAAFVSETHITLSKYLDLLEADDSSLLSKEFDDRRRDSETVNSVIQTWKLSFNQIRKQNPRAADILSLMAVLDRQGLQSFLFREQNEHEAEFLTALGNLQAFSLITSQKGGNIFRMHRLVQLATQSWLHLQGVLTKWREQALSTLSGKFPHGTYENWTICEGLSPHAHAILSCSFETESCLLQYAKLLHNSGWFEQAQGRYETAYKNISKAFEERERVLGSEHPDTLTNLGDLAEVVKSQGKYEEAEDMNRRALHGREKILGKEHSDTLTIIHNLALVLQHQGKYKEAEELVRRVVDSREKTLGKEHPYTLMCTSNLAAFLDDQGKHEAAEEMSRLVISSREKVLRKDHPDTLTSINSLAGTLHHQGQDKEAEELYQRVITTREMVIGKEHPDTLWSVYCLACVLHKQKKYKHALELYQRASSGFRKTLGSSHPSTLHCDWLQYSITQEMGQESQDVYAGTRRYSSLFRFHRKRQI